ncbi:regulatory LuxR family protein [Actinomycetospora succinea]|uniref:Regulatory LuxR family protein n=1 Tax=Actinomycetospora succinea TaxID=663603 RepID=A0A4R6VIN1_9PSEU|nr:LuxR C-terminal-related transcriptional regulator [Actinomycetospora succinea]TDQ62666.1 regulatory LuxR family protein [Actinomycetospora succinea]
MGDEPPRPEVWPLVGRDAHLAAIRAAAGRAAGVLLVGPPGSGRTRLAGEAARALAGPGTRVVAVTATPWTRDTPLGAVAARLPDAAPGGDDDLAALRRARAAVRGDADRVLLVVDDVHLLDALSARLVHDLARHREAFVVLTARAGATLPEPVLALRVDGLLERVETADLGPDDADVLVERALGGPVEGATRHELGALSGGNPFLLRELVDAGRAQGALRRSGPVWRWYDDVTPPPRLREVVLARTAELTAPQRELAELLALGGPLGLEVVEALPGGDEVAALERAGVVVSRAAGRRLEIAPARRLDAAVLRATFSPLGARRAHRTLAAALATVLDGLAGHRRREDTVRLLTWRVAGGEAVEPGELVAAGDHVVGDDPALAERLFGEAVDRGGGFAAASRLAAVRTLRGRFGEAAEAHARAAREEASDDEHADLAVTRAMLLAWALADPDGAVRVHDELAARIGGRPAPDGLAVLRAMLLLEGAKYAEADALLDPVLARLAPGSPTELPALMVAASVRPMIGRLEDGAAIAERALELIGRDASGLSSGLRLQIRAGGLWTSRLAQGRLDEAATLARAWYEETRGSGTAEAAVPRAIYAFLLGVDAARRGRLTTAIRWFHEAAAQAPLPDLPCSPQLAGEMIATLGQAGRAEEAAAWQERVDRGEARDLVHFRPWLHLGEAWVHAAAGRVESAAARAREVADEAAAAGQLCYEVDALHVVVRCGQGALVADRLAEVAARVDGPLAALHARHAAAGVEDLDDVAEGYAACGMLLLAVEVATTAAAAHRDAARTGAATASAGRARTWLEACEAPDTPALRVRVAADLTSREREIAELAASGMSSRAIAERLVLSVRTVDNALGASYAKLGVKGRAELRAVFGRRSAAELDR